MSNIGWLTSKTTDNNESLEEAIARFEREDEEVRIDWERALLAYRDR